MIAKLLISFETTLMRWIPDSFVIAVILTLLAMILSVTVAGFGAVETVNAWGAGFWDLLAFTNQIVLTLVLGYALANTPPVMRGLKLIASMATKPRAAYILVALVGAVSSLLSWGLGLVAGALMARFTGEECRRRGVRVHYPLLVAAGFSGFVLWHQGLSSSIGLAIATPGHFLENEIGIVNFNETILTARNGFIIGFILLTLPVLMALLHPSNNDVECCPTPVNDFEDDADNLDSPLACPAAYMERSRVLKWLITGLGAAYLFIAFLVDGSGVNLNLLNFIFLILGILMAPSLIGYMSLISNAVRVAAPFLLQYPFYAGVAAIMAKSGLAVLSVNAIVSTTNPQTLPLFSFFSAAALNIFVPSGGGQWAIQGPISISAAQSVGASVPDVAFAIMLGDQWSNLIHPLLLTPAAVIAGVPVQKILSFCAFAFCFTGAVFLTALILPIL